MPAQEQSYYRILHLLDNTPNAAYKPQLAALFDQLGLRAYDPYSIQDTSPNAQRVGSLQASPNPEDKIGAGFQSGNKINTGGTSGQVTDSSAENENQIAAPLKELVSGTIGATLLTHLADLRATLAKLIRRTDEVLDQNKVAYDNLVANENRLAEQQQSVETAITQINPHYTPPENQPRPSFSQNVRRLIEADAVLRELVPDIKQDVKTLGAYLKNTAGSIENASSNTHTIVKEAEQHLESSPFAIPRPGQIPTLKPE